MPIFGFLSIFAIGFYLFYKTKYFRTNRPMEKQWLSAKSSIALGAFVFFFGLNQIIVWGTTISTVIGAIFILVGGLSAIFGLKAKNYYFPLAVEEAQKSKE